MGPGNAARPSTTLVDAAHAAGVKVLVCVGDGYAQFYTGDLSEKVVKSLVNYIDDHNFDGVDVDVEDRCIMGDPYNAFMTALVKDLRPKGKLITAALQYGSDLPTSIYHQLDFDNVMAYTNFWGGWGRLYDYSVNKGIPIDQLVLGVSFGAPDPIHKGNFYEYSEILTAYPDAWSRNTVAGPAFEGATLNYSGEVDMAQQTLLGAQYGGIMIYSIGYDAPAPHSLLKIIQNNLYRNWGDCLFMDCSKQ